MRQARGRVLMFVLTGATYSIGWAQTISWDVLATGAESSSSSGGFGLVATIGQTVADLVEGPSYSIWSGFWNPDLVSSVGGHIDHDLVLPTTFSLSQNRPNPFRDRTTILFGLPRRCHVTIGIYDLRGQLIRILTDRITEPGYHATRWNGRDFADQRAGSGVYICRMTARGGVKALAELQKPLLLIK